MTMPTRLGQGLARQACRGAKARETAANLVATRDAPARHQGREIVAATFAALDGVAPNNIRSPTTEAYA